MNIKKHHFWMLCLPVVGIVLYCWNAGVAQIQNDFLTKNSQVEAHFAKARKVLGKPGDIFPNPGWEEEADESGKGVKKEVAATWDNLNELYGHFMAWPKELGSGFRTTAKKGGDFNEKQLAAYQVWANTNVAEGRDLEKLAGVQLDPIDGGVLWDEANLKAIKSKFQFNTQPKTAEVRRVQQEFWVITRLVSHLREIVDRDLKDRQEEEIKGKYDLPVRTIELIEIGVPAEKKFAKRRNFAKSKGNQRKKKGTSPPSGKQGNAQAKAPGKPPKKGDKPAAAPPRVARVDSWYDKNKKDKDSTGYVRMPVVLRVQMNVDRVPELLVLLAGEFPAVEVRDVFMSTGIPPRPAPRRTPKPAEENAPAPGVRPPRGGAGFGPRNPAAQPAPPPESEQPKANEPITSKYPRGIAQVEIHGVMYLVKPKNTDALKLTTK